MNNTKARSNFLMTLASEIAIRESIDPTHPPKDARAYLAEIQERGECHRETARQVWARYLRRARYSLIVEWGGKREGAGLKPGQSPKCNQKD